MHNIKLIVDGNDVISFEADARDAITLIHGWSSGQQKKPMVIVVDSRHYITDTHLGVRGFLEDGNKSIDHIFAHLFPNFAA